MNESGAGRSDRLRDHAPQKLTSEHPNSPDYRLAMECLVGNKSCKEDLIRIFLGNGGSATAIGIPEAKATYALRSGLIRNAIDRAIERFAAQNIDQIRASHQRIRDALEAAQKAGVWDASESARRFRQSEVEIGILLEWLTTKINEATAQSRPLPELKPKGGPGPRGALSDWMRNRVLVAEWLYRSDEILARSSVSIADWPARDFWQSCEQIDRLEKQIRRLGVARSRGMGEVTNIEIELSSQALELIRDCGEELQEFPELSAAKPLRVPDPGQLKRFENLLVRLVVAMSERYTIPELSILSAAWFRASVAAGISSTQKQQLDQKGTRIDLEGEIGRLIDSWYECYDQPGLASEIIECLPDFRGQAEGGQLPGLMLRLTLIVLIASVEIDNAVKLIAAERSRLNKSNFAQPHWIRTLTREARGPEKAAQRDMAIMLDAAERENPRPRWNPDFVWYALASKGCSVFGTDDYEPSRNPFGLFGLDFEEPYIGAVRNHARSLVTGQAVGVVESRDAYVRSLEERLDKISTKFGIRFESVNSWLNIVRGSSVPDLPGDRQVNEGLIDPSTADRRIAYLLGYEFADQIDHHLIESSDVVRAVLLPALTFPLRKQWNGKGFFRSRVPWGRVRWLIRWHAWYCAKFRRSVYDILVSRNAT